MTKQNLDAWVAEQVARFKPGDLDAGIEVIRRAKRLRADDALTDAAIAAD